MKVDMKGQTQDTDSRAVAQFKLLNEAVLALDAQLSNPMMDPRMRVQLKQRKESMIDTAKAIQESGRVFGDKEFARALAQGVTFGWGDEIEARFRTLGSDRGYEVIRDEIREDIAATEEAYPIQANAAEFAGGMAVPGGALKKVYDGAGNLLNLAGRIAGVGATGGSIAGAGYSTGETLPEIGTDAAIGAGTAAVAAPALAIGGPAVVSTAGGVLKRMTQEPGERADAIIGRLMRENNMTAEGATQILENLGEDAVLADLNRGLLGATAAAVGRSGSAAERVTDIEARQSRSQGRLIDDLETGTGASVADITEEAAERRLLLKQEAKENYDAVRYETVPRSEVANILDGPLAKKALKKAVEGANQRRGKLGLPPVDADDEMITIDVIDRTQNILGKRGRATKNDPGALFEAAEDLKESADTVLREQGNQGYVAARESYADSVSVIKAYELGQKMKNTTTNEVMDEIEKKFSDFNDEAKQAFRQGYLSTAADKITHAGGQSGLGISYGGLGTPAVRQRQFNLIEKAPGGLLEEAVNREQTYTETASILSPLVNSKTGFLRAAQESLDKSTGLQGALEESIAPDLNAVRNFISNVGGLPENVADEMGQRLLSTNQGKEVVQRMLDSGKIPRELRDLITNTGLGRFSTRASEAGVRTLGVGNLVE